MVQTINYTVAMAVTVIPASASAMMSSQLTSVGGKPVDTSTVLESSNTSIIPRGLFQFSHGDLC